MKGRLEGGGVPGKRSHGGRRRGEATVAATDLWASVWRYVRGKIDEELGARAARGRAHRSDFCSDHLLAAGWRRVTWPFSRGPPPPPSRLSLLLPRSRPQAQSRRQPRRVRYVAPPRRVPLTQPCADSTQRQCRNILIYGCVLLRLVSPFLLNVLVDTVDFKIKAVSTTILPPCVPPHQVSHTALTLPQRDESSPM